MSISLVLISHQESEFMRPCYGTLRYLQVVHLIRHPEFILVGHSQYGDTSMRTSGWTHARASMFPCTMFPALVRYACPRGACVTLMSPALLDLRWGPFARSAAPHQLQQAAAESESHSTCATSHLLLQHPDKTLATNVWNICKAPEKIWKHVCSHCKYCKIQTKTLATYV